MRPGLIVANLVGVIDVAMSARGMANVITRHGKVPGEAPDIVGFPGGHDGGEGEQRGGYRRAPAFECKAEKERRIQYPSTSVPKRESPAFGAQ